MNSRKYQVVIASGRHGYAPSLASAKKLGMKLGQLTERNDTKWNVSYVNVGILKQEGVGYYYTATGWRMFVPVRGTGARRATTVAGIKRRFGVSPYKWHKWFRG